VGRLGAADRGEMRKMIMRKDVQTIIQREHLEIMRKAHLIEIAKTHNAKVTKESIEKDVKKVYAKNEGNRAGRSRPKITG
jgi:hypothetical protein